MLIFPIVDPNALRLDGSNANTDIDIGTYDFTTLGEISGGTLTDGTFSVTAGVITGATNTNWDLAYDHSQDNTQAHTDYLINNGDDTTTGTLTVANLLVTSPGKVTADAYWIDTHKMIFTTNDELNLFIGRTSGNTLCTGSSNVGLGVHVLEKVTSSNENIAIGIFALSNITTGVGGNVALGTEALKALTTGEYNFGMGLGALIKGTTAHRNVAIGVYAGSELVGQTESVFIGHNAGRNVAGSYNTCIGAFSGVTNTAGTNNVFIGNYAGYYETGSNKLFIDNAQRASEADARLKALMYGVFDAATANQYLYINGTLVVGDHTVGSENMFQISSTGQVDMLGTARVKKYLTLGVPQLAKGAAAPDSGSIGTFPVLLFSPILTEEVRFIVHMPADWDITTDIELAVYWSPTDATDAKGVAWEFDWEAVAAEANEVMGAGSTPVAIHDLTQGVANELLETSYGTIAAGSLAVDDTIGIHLYRDHDDADDDYASDAALVHIEIEYTVNKLGEQM